MSKEPKNYRVSNAAAAGMMSVAVLADVIGLIPFLGWIGSILGGGAVALWLFMSGVPLIGPKRLINMLANAVGETVTAAVFPSVIIYTAIMLIIVRIEDKTGLSATSALKKAPTKSIKKLARRAAKPRRQQQQIAARARRIAQIRARRAAGSGMIMQDVRPQES